MDRRPKPEAQGRTQQDPEWVSDHRSIGTTSRRIRVSPFLAQAILRAGIVQYGSRLAGVDIEKRGISNFRVSDYSDPGRCKSL